VLLGRLLRNAEVAESGGGGGDVAPLAGAGPVTDRDKAPDLVKAVEGLIARHGDSTAALRVLLGENYTAREKIRELTNRLPPEGSRVLQGEDAKHWETYRQLGNPGDLRKALEAGKQYEAEVGAFRKAELVRAAAEVTGFKPSVLALAARDLEIEIQDQKDKGGKAIRVAVVKGLGEAAKDIPLTEYAEANWKDLLPSLRIAEERSIGTPRAGGMPPRPVPSPAQGATNGTTTPTPTRQRSSF
jgi:hypothetical protein